MVKDIVKEIEEMIVDDKESWLMQVYLVIEN